MNLCIYGASSNQIDPAYMTAVEELGQKLARRGHGLVFGGGAQGLMGAAARGVTAQKGYILGVAPSFFNVDGVLYEHCTEFIYTDTMRQRKQIMEDRADGFIMVPGGIGTYEEFFEMLTLKQLGRHSKPITILNLGGYYDLLQQLLEQTIRQGFMKPACRQLYGIFTDADALLDYLEQAAPAPADVQEMKHI